MGLGNKLKRPFGSSRAPESSSKLIGPSVWSEGTNPVVEYAAPSSYITACIPI
jgi:hypothetical protein